MNKTIRSISLVVVLLAGNLAVAGIGTNPRPDPPPPPPPLQPVLTIVQTILNL